MENHRDAELTVLDGRDVLLEHLVDRFVLVISQVVQHLLLRSLRSQCMEYRNGLPILYPLTGPKLKLIQRFLLQLNIPE